MRERGGGVRHWGGGFPDGGHPNPPKASGDSSQLQISCLWIADGSTTQWRSKTLHRQEGQGLCIWGNYQSSRKGWKKKRGLVGGRGVGVRAFLFSRLWDRLKKGKGLYVNNGGASWPVSQTAVRPSCPQRSRQANKKKTGEGNIG